MTGRKNQTQSVTIARQADTPCAYALAQLLLLALLIIGCAPRGGGGQWLRGRRLWRRHLLGGQRWRQRLRRRWDGLGLGSRRGRRGASRNNNRKRDNDYAFHADQCDTSLA